jgi:hypothetical protein
LERKGRGTLTGPRLQLIGTWALGAPGAGGVLVTVSICLAVHVFPPSFGAVRETSAPANMGLVLVIHKLPHKYEWKLIKSGSTYQDLYLLRRPSLEKLLDMFGWYNTRNTL